MCARTATHGSNRPDAPRGDERASVAVSQRRYYFTLHERRMKREVKGELVPLKEWKRQQCRRSAGLKCRELDKVWVLCGHVSSLVTHCEAPTGHLSVIYPIKFKRQISQDVGRSTLSLQSSVESRLSVTGCQTGDVCHSIVNRSVSRVEILQPQANSS